MALGLIRYIREGIRRKWTGSDIGVGRILVIENSQLNFDLGPLLSKVLRIPHFDVRKGEIPKGRAVVSAEEVIPHYFLIDLRGNFGEYLLEESQAGKDIRMEALKISLQQMKGGWR